MFRTIALTVAVALTLAGCQTITNTDAAIQKNLAAACVVVETLNVSFLAYAAELNLRPSVLALEAKAYGEAQSYCDHPETANTVTAVATVIRLSATIVGALREAEAAKAKR